MAVATLILGIVALILSFIPGCGIILVCIPVLVGIILGIIALAKKKGKKGFAITGIILLIISVILSFVSTLVFGLGASIFNAASEVISSENNNINSNIEYSIGQTHKGEDVNVRYISVNKDFKDYSEYSTVEEGYKVIKADFEFENVSSITQYISSYKFECYADGVECDDFWIGTNSSFSSSLPAGEKVKGSVYYEVPNNAEEITLEYTESYLDEDMVKFHVK